MKKIIIFFIIFFVTGKASAFLGAPGDATLVIGGICALLYLIFSRKKKNSNTRGKASNSSSSSSERYSSSRSTDYTDYWDQRNIPSHWIKARACVDGDHGDLTVSPGNAYRCYLCGKRFDGEWGNRGVFDGYFCQIHKKWIPRGSYCAGCKIDGLIP